MADVFSSDGAGGGTRQGGAARGSPGGGEPPGPQRSGESAPGRYVTFDNETGEVLVTLPPELERFQGELGDLIYQEFYGDVPDVTRLNEFVAEFVERKTEEERHQRPLE